MNKLSEEIINIRELVLPVKSRFGGLKQLFNFGTKVKDGADKGRTKFKVGAEKGASTSSLDEMQKNVLIPDS